MTYVTADYLRSILDYDPETGLFTWLPRPREHFATQRAYSTWNSFRPGSVAGSKDKDGYRMIMIAGRRYFSHRLAWLIETGTWPKHGIDHRDKDPSNNRWRNLREATKPQNGANRGAQNNSFSGVKGVSWCKFTSNWLAQIKANGKYHFLGRFENIDEAAAAYAKSAHKLHGEFARLE